MELFYFSKDYLNIKKNQDHRGITTSAVQEHQNKELLL